MSFKFGKYSYLMNLSDVLLQIVFALDNSSANFAGHTYTHCLGVRPFFVRSEKTDQALIDDVTHMICYPLIEFLITY